MKIMIISDTHRERRNFYKAIEREKPIDLLVHCGDVIGEDADLAYIAGCKIEAVAGNMDFHSDLPGEKVFQIGNYKVFLTHGHLYGANYSEKNLREAGEYEGADIVMYGHTHIPKITRYGDIVVLNPGSISFPRQADHKASYAIMTIDDAGEAHYEIKYI